MKIKFNNAEDLTEAINLIASDCRFVVCNDGQDMEVDVAKSDKLCVKVSINGKKARIEYGEKVQFFRALGHLAEALADDKIIYEKEEYPLFEKNGAMFATQVASPKPEMIKIFIKKMALMGMNTLQINTETTYELAGYPYFGYARGRYSKEELKELDTYAQKFGIELIPSIQLTGHFSDYLKYNSAEPIKDTASVLLADTEATYKMIDEILKTLSECFSSRRINMGCDETFGIGTGAYKSLYGEKDPQEIYCRHIAKLAKMAKSYGFEPMIWGDMFFAFNAKRSHPDYCFYEADAEFPPVINEYIPHDLGLIFWEYSNSGKDFHEPIIRRMREISDNVVFAGGLKVWQSSVPQYKETLKCTVPALNACKKQNVKEVFVTVWCGDEVAHSAALPGCLIYAEYNYTGRYDKENMAARCRSILGTEWEAFLEMEEADKLHRNDVPELASFFVLHNDPLNGLMDYHIKNTGADEYYGKLYESFKKYCKPGELYEPLFDFHLKLLKLLSLKAEFGLKLKAAYDADDKEELKKLAERCDEICKNIYDLKEAKYILWNRECKPQGYEVYDSYYGTLAERIKTAKRRITDYLFGKAERIEELEMKRLPYDRNRFGNPSEENIFFAASQRSVFTVF